jgi:hypothetical protein
VSRNAWKGGVKSQKRGKGVFFMMTRKDLAKRWKTTPRTIDRRRVLGLLPWVDLALGIGKRPQVRFRLEDVEEFERQARMCPEGGAFE